MKRWICFLGLAFAALVFSVPQAQAAFIIRQNCDEVSELAEELDRHTEDRFLRYLRNNSFPRSFSAEEQLQRWCYLWNDKNARDAARRDRGHSNRASRTLEERFYLTEEEKEGIVVPTPEGSFENLPQNRKARILERVKNDNCDPGGGTERELEEYAFCLQLMQERNARREEILQSRRNIAGGGATRLRSAAEERRVRRLAGHASKFAPADRSSILERAEKGAEMFDSEGPGSEPLSNALEAKIKRAVNRGDCSRLRSEEERIRCLWLMAKDRFQRAALRARVEKRVRTSGVSASSRLRRGVSVHYRSLIGTTRAAIQHRRLEGGFRPTPRTIQDLKQYKDPVVVPGDCEIDPKLCNK